MPARTRSVPQLPAAELDTIPQFAARANTSVRTVHRLIGDGMPIVKIGRATRIDPERGMAFVRGELPAPS
jgi:hypothetical protein